MLLREIETELDAMDRESQHPDLIAYFNNKSISISKQENRTQPILLIGETSQHSEFSYGNHKCK